MKARNGLLGASLVNFDINNINIRDLGIAVPILIILVFFLFFVLIYKSHTVWGFKTRKFVRNPFSKKDSKHYKKFAKILFIDDKDIPIAETLEDDNWVVRKVRDAQLDSQEVKEANIIFVDWKGVGRKMSSESEGIELANSLKRKYGCEKYIILYSAREYQKPEGLSVDDWINKGSDFSTYSDKIQAAAFALFG